MVIELLAGTMRRGRVRIAAVEDDMRQTYTVKHIRKGLTLLGYSRGGRRMRRTPQKWYNMYSMDISGTCAGVQKPPR